MTYIFNFSHIVTVLEGQQRPLTVLQVLVIINRISGRLPRNTFRSRQLIRERERDRQIDRQTDRDRETERETDRDKDTELTLLTLVSYHFRYPRVHLHF